MPGTIFAVLGLVIYGLDALGNRTQVTSNGTAEDYTANELNQYLTKDAADFQYDLNGNLIEQRDTVSGLARHFEYNTQNQLIKVILEDGSEIVFHYDVLGRRISKTTSAGTLRYLWDGNETLAETDISGNLLRSYAHGPEVDELLYQVDYSAGVTLYFHTDHLMSTLALSDSAGQLVESYSYDAYGNLSQSLDKDGADILNPATDYLYTGRQRDSETDLYYNRNRYYDPSLGRFLNADPSGYEAGLNLYAYVSNNPLTFRDPQGLDTYWGGYGGYGGYSGGGGSSSYTSFYSSAYQSQSYSSSSYSYSSSSYSSSGYGYSETGRSVYIQGPSSSGSSGSYTHSGGSSSSGSSSGGVCSSCGGGSGGGGGPQPSGPPSSSQQDQQSPTASTQTSNQGSQASPVQAMVRAISNFIQNPPDSTFASGVLGFLEKAKDASFFAQSYNSASGLPLAGHHLTYPLRGVGELASRLALPLELAATGLEVGNIALSHNTLSNKTLKTGVTIALNIVIYVAVGAVTGLLATSVPGVIAVLAVGIFAAKLGEAIKKSVFSLINSKVR